MHNLISRTTCLVMLLAFAYGTTICQTDHAKNVSENLDHLIENLFSLDLSPGMAVAVVRDNEVLYSRGFGYADREAKRPTTPETLFYIASTTKSFTAFAVAVLDHEGKMHLDSSIHSYLPTLKLHQPLSADSISLRALLTHTHGIEDDGPVVFRTAFSGVYTNDQLIALLAKHKPSATGTKFVYGNLGYNVAGFAMEGALGLSWKDIVQQRVLEPVGMNSTYAKMSGIAEERLAMPYAAGETGYRRLRFMKSDANMHAAGGHVSTALDLAKWLIAHISAGRLNGRQVFPEDVVAETHRSFAVQDRDFAMFHRFGWGLGWDLGTYEGDTLIHRFGSFPGFRSHVSFMPRRQLGVVVLVNESTLGSYLCDVVASSIYDELLQKPNLSEKLKASFLSLQENSKKGRTAIGKDESLRAARPQLLPHPVGTYAGTFENDELGRMEWRIVDGRLEVSLGLASSKVEVYNGPENKFRVELTGGGEVVTFLIEGEQAKQAYGLTYSGRQFTRIDR